MTPNLFILHAKKLPGFWNGGIIGRSKVILLGEWWEIPLFLFLLRSDRKVGIPDDLSLLFPTLQMCQNTQIIA